MDVSAVNKCSQLMQGIQPVHKQSWPLALPPSSHSHVSQSLGRGHLARQAFTSPHPRHNPVTKGVVFMQFTLPTHF